MRIHTVKNRQAGKVFNPEHKGRTAVITHNQYVGHKSRQTHKILPAEDAIAPNMVHGHVLPADGVQFRTKKRAAQP